MYPSLLFARERVVGALDLCTSVSFFFPLQRRLREAVQLLEDYKHGTLRPGVTNEQVILLEVEKEGRQVTFPSLQPEPLSFLHYPLLLLLHSHVDFWLSGGDTQVFPYPGSRGKHGGR